MKVLRLGNVLVEVHAWGTRMAWPDGSEVLGAPHDTDEYRKTALLCGYGSDRMKLCIEHEVVHALFEWVLGVPSEVMKGQRGQPVDQQICWKEEAAVLAFQQYITARGISLIERL